MIGCGQPLSSRFIFLMQCGWRAAGTDAFSFSAKSLQSREMTEVAPWTVRRLLEWTNSFFARKDVHAPRLSAEQLLAHILKYPRIRLYTEYERPLSDAELAAFRALVQRAAEQEP